MVGSAGWQQVPQPVRRAHERGLVVIPRPSESRRWIAWKEYQTRRPTRAEIVAWHKADPDSIWQVLCGLPGGISALDFDVKRGQRGMETLAKLNLGATVDTPSGGAHVWVRSPEHVVRSR